MFISFEYWGLSEKRGEGEIEVGVEVRLVGIVVFEVVREEVFYFLSCVCFILVWIDGNMV